MSKWLGLAIVVALASGCYNSGAFVCGPDKPCKAGDTCEPGFNLCGFPDETCGPGGHRFDDLGGSNAGKCVNGPPIDAGDNVGAEPLPLPIDGPPIDGPPPPPPDSQTCFGTGILHICLATPPAAPLPISTNTTIDTMTSTMCATVTSVGDFCVLAGTTINISATLRATGTRPLVLIASDSITTTASGKIDVGSHRGANPEIGAGAEPASCLPGTGPDPANGGAGGSFTGLGGNGGGGTPGIAGPVAGAVTTLRGGCAGQDGGGNNKGVRGHGGGAVFLIAVNSINVQGGINAAGEGATAGTTNSSGGGGGGSGGMIGFDATTIMASSLILANGGGGGEGSGTSNNGNPGADPNAITAAAGGSGASNSGGDGGNGSAGAAAGAGSPGLTDTNSGGGGGGGAGLIIAPATATLGNMVSPARTP